MKHALLFLLPLALHAQTPVGVQGAVGAPADAKVVNRLEITKPGVYENLIIDGNFASGNLVKITADNVTLRNCEIRHSAGNGIGIFGNKVVIENCRIHHLLNGTFEDQQDAHGISGRWGDTIIRNCDISFPSGDCIQFDPDRKSSGKVVIENCTLWTAPLDKDLAGFKAGQRPGENAMDTKVPPDGPRCQLVIKNCHMHGWNQPAQIDNVAALNLKENVDAEVSGCVFQNNEIALRVRGPGKRGGAHVTASDCAIYDTQTGVRAEDKIEVLKLVNLGFGGDIGRRVQFVGGRSASGIEITGEHDAPAPDELLKRVFRCVECRMAWRFDKCVINGEIDNTVRGRVTGKLWLLGREEPMTLDLIGDAWPDLAGCRLTFVNTNPVPQPQYDKGLSMMQTGSVGDITASMKLKKLLVPEEEWMKAIEEKRFHEVPWVLSSSLYLEWFSDRNGRVVIQTTDYTLEVSERHWEADADDEVAQQAINDENMRAYMEDLGRALDAQDDSEDDESAK